MRKEKKKIRVKGARDARIESLMAAFGRRARPLNCTCYVGKRFLGKKKNPAIKGSRVC